MLCVAVIVCLFQECAFCVCVTSCKHTCLWYEIYFLQYGIVAKTVLMMCWYLAHIAFIAICPS